MTTAFTARRDFHLDRVAYLGALRLGQPGDAAWGLLRSDFTSEEPQPLDAPERICAGSMATHEYGAFQRGVHRLAGLGEAFDFKLAHLQALRRVLATLVAVTSERDLFAKALVLTRRAGFFADIRYAIGDDYCGPPSRDDVLIILGAKHELRLRRDGMLSDIEAI